MYVDEGIAFIIIWTSLPEFYKKGLCMRHTGRWNTSNYLQAYVGENFIKIYNCFLRLLASFRISK